jgi:hypothetical protein
VAKDMSHCADFSTVLGGREGERRGRGLTGGVGSGGGRKPLEAGQENVRSAAVRERPGWGRNLYSWRERNALYPEASLASGTFCAGEKK